MGAHQIGRDGEAEAGSAGFGSTLKGLEQASAQMFGDAGAVVGDAHRDDGTFAPGLQCDGAVLELQCLRLAVLDRLGRVAHQVGQDAEELIAVGIDGEVLRHIVVEHDPARGFDRDALDHLIDEQVEDELVAPGRRLLGAADISASGRTAKWRGRATR